MNELHEVGERDGWRCWLCDEPVDADMPSRDSRGASVDTRITKARAKKKKISPPPARLAHVGCNTGKGAKEPVVTWPADLFVIDPVDIIPAADRLARKGGQEIMARCPTAADAELTLDWLIDRLSRLHPELNLSGGVEEGGGQFLVRVQEADR